MNVNFLFISADSITNPIPHPVPRFRLLLCVGLSELCQIFRHFPAWEWVWSFTFSFDLGSFYTKIQHYIYLVKMHKQHIQYTEMSPANLMLISKENWARIV